VPERAADFNQEVRINFDDGSATGLKIRNQVAVPTDGSNADITLAISHQHWAAVLGGKTALAQLVREGDAQAAPDKDQVLCFFSCFDLESLTSS
jgi:alkyl sulfatase BDS1-like metallo-beta-lactamase superfamily hydrolase